MSRGINWQKLLREGLSVAARMLSASQTKNRRGTKRPPLRTRQRATWKTPPVSDARTAVDEGSPGQFGRGATRDATAAETQRISFVYAPEPDGDPDPGEVVWTWVPYVENDGRGKDRPVLVVGRIDANRFAACYLSTTQHRGFVSIGTGSWDSKGRESFLNPQPVSYTHLTLPTNREV